MAAAVTRPMAARSCWLDGVFLAARSWLSVAFMVGGQLL